MKLSVLSVGFLFGACLALGADGKIEKQEKAEVVSIPSAKQAPAAARPVRAKDSAATDPSFSVTDTWSSFTVQGGSIFKLTSTNDYTGAEHVSVAIECPVGNSLQNVSITVFWGNSLATYLSATDVISSASFAYRNVGGAVVPVYGSQLMMQVTNAGTGPVTCDQVTTYAVVH